MKSPDEDYAFRTNSDCYEPRPCRGEGDGNLQSEILGARCSCGCSRSTAAFLKNKCYSPTHHCSSHCAQQYYFNPSEHVWTSGLYCSIEEDLQLDKWSFLQSCRQVWEKFRESPRNKKESGLRKERKENVRRADQNKKEYTSPCRSRVDINVAQKDGTESESQGVTYRDVATSPFCSMISDDPMSEHSLSLESINSASQTILYRDVATSPSPSLVYDDHLSDHSLSLESISSSSFHFSSDCEGES